MNLPIQFPDEGDVIADEVARFRALSPEQRAEFIRGLINTGETLIRASGKAAFIRQYADEQREEARRAIREFIARHAA